MDNTPKKKIVLSKPAPVMHRITSLMVRPLEIFAIKIHIQGARVIHQAQ